MAAPINGTNLTEYCEEVVGQWPGRPRGRPGEAGCARGSPAGREPLRSEVRPSCGRLRGTSLPPLLLRTRLGPCGYPDAGLGVGVQQRSPAAIPKPRHLFSDPTMSLNNTVASMRSGAAGGRTGEELGHSSRTCEACYIPCPTTARTRRSLSRPT